MDVEGRSGESSAAADILRRMTSSIPLLLQVASVYCAYSAATARVVLLATSSRLSPCTATHQLFLGTGKKLHIYH